MRKLAYLLFTLALLVTLVSCNDTNYYDTIDTTNTEQTNSIQNQELDNINPTPQTNISNNTTDKSIINDTSKTTDTEVLSNNTNKIDFGGGENSICSIHNFAYHWYDSALISYIGEDRFTNWAKSISTEDVQEGCISSNNIYKCIEHFDIPNEIIIELYQNDYLNNDWDMEALLARNEKAFEESALQKATLEYHNNVYKKLESEIKFKRELFRRIGELTDTKSVEYYNKVTNNGNTNPVYTITIQELVNNTTLTKTDLEEALAFATSYDGIENYQPHFNYNFNLLFGSGVSVLNNNITNIEPKPYESVVMLSDALLHVSDNTATS